MSAWNHIGRLLTFRICREEILQFDNRHLVIGIITTWLVGMGRWWDDPKASLLQHLGLGSVIYIFVLSAFIYLIVWPFRPADWNYKTLLTFISLTSFPAVLYAIPVERIMTMSNAASLNAKFLMIVAAYRMALLIFFLNRFTRLNGFYIFTLVLLPVCLIIVVLTVLNLERAVFDIMGGIRDETPHDRAYAVLNTLTFFSIILLPLLIIFYIAGIVQSYQSRKRRQND